MFIERFLELGCLFLWLWNIPFHEVVVTDCLPEEEKLVLAKNKTLAFLPDMDLDKENVCWKEWDIRGKATVWPETERDKAKCR